MLELTREPVSEDIISYLEEAGQRGIEPLGMIAEPKGVTRPVALFLLQSSRHGYGGQGTFSPAPCTDYSQLTQHCTDQR